MDSPSSSPQRVGREGAKIPGLRAASPLSGSLRLSAAGSVPGTVQLLSVQALLSELAPALVALLLAVLTVTAIGVAARRISGSFVTADASGWILAWIVATAIVAAGSRALWFATIRHRSAIGDLAVTFFPLAAVVVSVCALTSSAGPAATIVLAWLIALGEEITTFALWHHGGRSLHFDRAGDEIVALVRRFNGPRPPATRVRRHPRAPIARPPTESANSAASPPLVDESTVRNRQTVDRVQSADGRDVLRGRWSSYFAPGQTTAQVHIAFCPPFTAVPRLEYRQVAGPAARIKIGQALPHGARLELKLAAAVGEESRVGIEVVATREASGRTADQETPGKPGG